MKVIVGIYKYEEVEVEVDDKFTPIEERKRYIKSTRFPDFTKIAALSEKTYAEFVKAVEDKTGCPVISKGKRQCEEFSIFTTSPIFHLKFCTK